MGRIFLKYESVLILASIILFASCSTTTQYQLLSTFFDGVPNPNDNNIENPDSIITTTEKPTNAHKQNSNNQPENIYHPPYKNRLCKECHDIRNGNQITQKIPLLCYRCHTNITGQNPALHGPVAMGDCLVCHSPHLSKNKFLLVKTGRDLCLHCHEKNYVYENSEHRLNMDKACLECHDPHSGKDRFLLN